MGGFQNPTSDTIQAILRTSKHERDALFASRRKLADVLAFLKAKGFKEEDVLNSSLTQGFGRANPLRDDFGLPVAHSVEGDPFKDKMKSKVEDSSSKPNAAKVCDGKSQSGIAETGVPMSKSEPDVSKKAEGTGATRSWSQVVKETEVELDYCPLPVGSNVVCPPDEELRKGLEKFKFCVVGFFTKGTMPLNAVTSIANKLWSSKGLISVMQKDSRKFVFKFASSAAMNSVLAHGTWYFERKPMLVSPWGKTSDDGKSSSMPIWIKLTNIPECY